MVEALAWVSHRKGSSKQGPIPEFQQLQNEESEAKPESHLHQSGLVELRRYLSERRICGRSVGHVWLSKLNAIEQIKRFRSKLQIEAFGDGRPLEDREIVICDTWTSEHRVRSALVPERKWRRQTKAGCIEPAVETGLSRAGNLHVAVWCYVRTQSSIEARRIRRSRKSKR